MWSSSSRSPIARRTSPGSTSTRSTTRRRRSRTRSLLRPVPSSVERVVGADAQFLGVVAERAEAHLEHLGGLGLHAAGAVESLLHELGANAVEVGLEIEPLLGK